MRSVGLLTVLVAPALLLAIAARHAIGETMEGPACSTALGVVAGLAVGCLLLVALNGRHSHS